MIFKKEDFSDIFTWGAQAAADRANAVLEKKSAQDIKSTIESLRAELSEMTSMKDKAADIAIAIAFEHNQQVDKLAKAVEVIKGMRNIERFKRMIPEIEILADQFLRGIGEK